MWKGAMLACYNMTMAAVPGVLSYGPNPCISVFKIRSIIFFLEMVSHLFACVCVLAFCSLPLLCS